MRQLEELRELEATDGNQAVKWKAAMDLFWEWLVFACTVFAVALMTVLWISERMLVKMLMSDNAALTKENLRLQDQMHKMQDERKP